MNPIRYEWDESFSAISYLPLFLIWLTNLSAIEKWGSTWNERKIWKWKALGKRAYEHNGKRALDR